VILRDLFLSRRLKFAFDKINRKDLMPAALRNWLLVLGNNINDSQTKAFFLWKNNTKELKIGDLMNLNLDLTKNGDIYHAVSKLAPMKRRLQWAFDKISGDGATRRAVRKWLLVLGNN
jgi:hypothetical protein